MHSSKQATSIIEAMVVLLIVVSGVVGMYKVYIESIRLSSNTQKKIQAIQIARDGIEAVINIRDTNWKIFGGDKGNCWNTLNYNTSCIGSTTTTTDIPDGDYIVYKRADDMWILDARTTGAYTGAYITNFDTGFPVGIDSDGFYTQSGGLSVSPMNTRYTREIQISYPGGNSNSDEMEVTSIVQWQTNRSNQVYSVELDVVLGNWED